MSIKRKAVRFLLLSFFLLVCGCPTTGIFLYDYGHLFYKSANWSDFSLLDTSEDVKSVLEENLLIGEATFSEVIAFLSQMEVNSCTLSQDRKFIGQFSPREIHDDWEYELGDRLRCSTVAHETIIDHSNPLNIRADIVLCDWLYIMYFYFNQGVLTEIETKETCVGGL